jgi:hypothetical protein
MTQPTLENGLTVHSNIYIYIYNPSLIPSVLDVFVIYMDGSDLS